MNEPSELAKRIAEEIEHDCNDRSGLSWGGIDDETQAGIRESWRAIIASHIAPLEAENERLRKSIHELEELVSETERRANERGRDNAALRQQVAQLNEWVSDREDMDHQITKLRQQVETLRTRNNRYHKWIMEQVSVCGGLSLASAQQLNLCRICGQPPTNPTILNYGKEYACEKCLSASQTSGG